MGKPTADELLSLRVVAVDNVLFSLETKTPIAHVSETRYTNLLASSAAMYSALTQISTILDAVIMLAEDARDENLAGQLQQTVSDIQLLRRCAVEGATAVFVDSKQRKEPK